MVCFAHSMGEYASMFKILVVEDDKELNRSVCSYLGRNGYDAIGCLNADDAHDAMYENVFDLIISDIMMPGTDERSKVIDEKLKCVLKGRYFEWWIDTLVPRVKHILQPMHYGRKK